MTDRIQELMDRRPRRDFVAQLPPHAKQEFDENFDAG